MGDGIWQRHPLSSQQNAFLALAERAPTKRNPASLRSLLGIDVPSAVHAAVIANVQTAHVRIQLLEVRSEPEVTVPAFLLTAAKTADAAPVLVVLDDVLAQRLWFEPEADDVLPENSPALICAADLRGVGTLAPQFSPGAPEYESWHQQEENYSWSSLYFGRPLIGQRVRDILSLTAALRGVPETSGRPLHLAARGRLVFRSSCRGTRSQNFRVVPFRRSSRLWSDNRNRNAQSAAR